MKALEKFPLFESSGLSALCSYLAEHYSPQERSALHESLALLPNDIPRIAGFVSSVEWLDNALRHAARAREGAGLEAASALLAFFKEQRDHVAFRDLEEYFPHMGREALCAGVRLGVQRAVFFVGLRRTDLEPLVGIWPAAARRLRRLSVVLAPEPVSVNEAFSHPFLVEDMTGLLVAARNEPILLRRDDEKPYSRFVADVGDMLLTLPESIESLTGLSLEGRIGLALQALRLTGLLVPGNAVKGGTTPLEASADGIAWMRLPLSERCRLVTRALTGAQGRQSRLFDLLEEEWSTSEGDREDILPWIVQAFSSVPTSTFIRFADFAEYQAAIGSPLDPPATGAGAATEEALEELWKSFLGIFLGRCLLALGGAEAGLTPEGSAAFRMHDSGRQLLGFPRDGRAEDWGGGVPPDAPLIVQPSFEIVFLSPSPGAEAECARFCERIGREVGVLFRLTRQSLQRAARAGLGSANVLDTLRRGSRSPLPANVVHEIGGWMEEG
jgi:hypothetical protein